MKIHDDIYEWKGWGGKFNLGSGRCRLRIFDLRKGESREVPHLKPIIVVVTDVPDESPRINKMTVKSWSSHIATHVVKDFDIDPHRMIWIEHYPERNGDVSNKFEVVDFVWKEGLALHPKWKPLTPTMLETVSNLVEAD